MKYNPIIISLTVLNELDFPINQLVLQFYNDLFTGIVVLTVLIGIFADISSWNLKNLIKSYRV